jgi:hypothetical protein
VGWGGGCCVPGVSLLPLPVLLSLVCLCCLWCLRLTLCGSFKELFRSTVVVALISCGQVDRSPRVPVCSHTASQRLPHSPEPSPQPLRNKHFPRPQPLFTPTHTVAQWQCPGRQLSPLRSWRALGEGAHGCIHPSIVYARLAPAAALCAGWCPGGECAGALPWRG